MGRTIDTPSSVRRLEGLYRRYHRRVRWVLRGRGIRGPELDDVVHDVFLALHRRDPGRDPHLAEELWVIGVARNVAFAHRRGHARRMRMLDDAPQPTPPPSLDDQLARREAWQSLQAFLEDLPEDQREAFILMDLLGMATTEIAEVTGAPANTVSSRVRLARRRFDRRFAGLRDRQAVFLRAAGLGERPSRQQRRRTWAGIVAAIPGPAGPGIHDPTPGASIVKWAVGSAVVTTLAIGLHVQGGDPPGELRSARGTGEDPPASTDVGSPMSRADRIERSEGPTLGAPPGPMDPEQPEFRQHRDARAARGVSPRSRRGPERPTASSAPEPAPPELRMLEPTVGHPSPGPSTAEHRPAHAEGSLSDAIALLRRAEAQLTAGDPAGALVTIDAYRARFERGPLLRDRLRIERRAACAQGRAERAHAARTELVALGLTTGDEPDCP